MSFRTSSARLLPAGLNWWASRNNHSRRELVVNTVPSFLNQIPLFLVLSLPVAPSICVAQSGRLKTEPAPSIAPDTRTAQLLYEEAKGYTEKKYEEFNKQNIQFDPKLEAATRQEQKGLATRHAATVAAREPLFGNDLYYLGLLYHVADNSDGALHSLRRFVSGNSSGELAQMARAAIVVHALKKNLLPEAESTLAEYSQQQPQSSQERYGMELLVADAFYKQKDHERMTAHAREMLNASKLAALTIEPLKRDQMLFKSAVMLSEGYRKLGRQDLMVSALDEVRGFAVSLPSGNLYKMTTARLLDLAPAADPLKVFEEAGTEAAKGLPEIVAAEWMDQTPGKLADFRGHVVLLDFWATWCGPCRETFPKLKAWHEKYRGDGLVILGLTNFFGEINGHNVTRTQESAYLRSFKKKNHLPYGFAIADSHVNDMNYGVFSIPMSFLIDRNGRVRFIAAGSSEAQTAALGRMIKRLLDEPTNGVNEEKGKGETAKKD